jgi:hypothetical protein
MWSHFINILARVLHAMPAIISSNWPAVFLTLGIFIFLQTLILWQRRWKTVRQWAQNVGIEVVWVLAGWIVLFLVSTVITLYHDHADLAGRSRAIVNEKNDLKIDLKNRDDYIQKLQFQIQHLPRNSPRPIQTPAPQIAKQCWLENLPQEPNPAIPQSHSATTALIHRNYKIDAPFYVAVKFDREFLYGNIFIVGAGVEMKGNPIKQPGNVIYGEISSPSVPANQIVAVTVEAPTKIFPNALDAKIQSK